MGKHDRRAHVGDDQRALVGLVGTSWFLNRDALQRAVEAQIRAVTGLELVVNGPIDVSVFPGSYVSFHNVGLKGADTAGPALQVDVLTANLRLLPLLLRRFEIADVMMLRPHIRVVRDAAGDSNWTPFVETIAKAMTPGAENQVSFSEIRIQDGELNYEDGTNSISEQLGDIDLSLAWPSISRSFAATGQFDWRGERVDGATCDERDDGRLFAHEAEHPAKLRLDLVRRGAVDRGRVGVGHDAMTDDQRAPAVGKEALLLERR